MRELARQRVASRNRFMGQVQPFTKGMFAMRQNSSANYSAYSIGAFILRRQATVPGRQKYRPGIDAVNCLGLSGLRMGGTGCGVTGEHT